jgi:ribosomal protein S17E
MAPQQMLFINRIVKEKSPDFITTIYDNDPNGIKYTCNLLNKIFEDNPFDVEISVTKTEVSGFITSDMEKLEFIGQINKNFGKTAEMKFSRAFSGKSQATLTFPCSDNEHVMPTLKKFVEGVYRLKNIPDNFNTEYPSSKDFNDDLKSIKTKNIVNQISIN